MFFYDNFLFIYLFFGCFNFILQSDLKSEKYCLLISGYNFFCTRICLCLHESRTFKYVHFSLWFRSFISLKCRMTRRGFSGASTLSSWLFLDYRFVHFFYVCMIIFMLNVTIKIIKLLVFRLEKLSYTTGISLQASCQGSSYGVSSWWEKCL